MQLKHYLRYEMNFQSNWLRNCVFLMGVSFFTRMLSFFESDQLHTVTGGDWVFQLILPSLCCLVGFVLLRILRWNAPGVYAIIGCLLSFLLIIWSFSYADALRSVLSVIIYTAAAIVLLGTAAGFLPGRLLSCALYLLPLIARLLFYRDPLYSGSILEELSALSLIASLALLPLSFRPLKVKERSVSPT